MENFSPKQTRLFYLSSSLPCHRTRKYRCGLERSDLFASAGRKLHQAFPSVPAPVVEIVKIVEIAIKIVKIVKIKIKIVKIVEIKIKIVKIVKGIFSFWLLVKKCAMSRKL